MIKEIYVARDLDGDEWEYENKPVLNDAENAYKDGGGKCAKRNTFNLTLKLLECVKVTIDTLNQSYRVEKVPVREDGYYAAVSATSKDVTWILQSKGDVWYYYHGSRMHDVGNLKIGTKPIPAEYLP